MHNFYNIGGGLWYRLSGLDHLYIVLVIVWHSPGNIFKYTIDTIYYTFCIILNSLNVYRKTAYFEISSR